MLYFKAFHMQANSKTYLTRWIPTSLHSAPYRKSLFITPVYVKIVKMFILFDQQNNLKTYYHFYICHLRLILLP